MSRATYEYQKFTNVAGMSGVFSNLRTFAVAQGWTLEYFNTSNWIDFGDGTYGWSGSGIYTNLGLYSDGYGSQDLHIRFRKWNHDTNNDRVYIRPIKPGYRTPNSLSGYYPDGQNHWAQTSVYTYMELPAGTIPEICIIGNNKWIGVVMLVHSFVSIGFCFGTFELTPDNYGEDEMMMYRQPSTDLGGSWEDLSNVNYQYIDYWYGLFGQNAYHTYWRAQSSGAHTNPLVNSFVEHTKSGYYSEWGSALTWLIKQNTWAGYRNMYTSPVLAKQADNTWIHMGYNPWYYINAQGLSWGDIVTRGTENYILFPSFYTTTGLSLAFKVNVS